jgi:hypothetical protein
MLFIMLFRFCAFGQGSFEFDNFSASPSNPAFVTISTGPGTFNPADGPAGAFVGSNYTASAYYLNGTVTDQALFDSSNPILFPSANTHFFGITGGLVSDGAGFFDHGGTVTLPTTGTVTVQVRAWYNGGGLYTSYDQSLAAGQNVGESIPVPVELAISTQSIFPLGGLLPFTVGVVPEPSVYALLGVGGLLLFHQQKKALCSRRC